MSPGPVAAHTALTGPARTWRRRLPLLLPVLLLLLAVGAVAVGQFYWVHLHDSMDRLEQSIRAARAQQQAMVLRVREAEALLAARAAQLAQRPDPGPRGAAETAHVSIPRDELAATADALGGIADGIAGAVLSAPAIDWPHLRAELRLLAHDAGRLPAPRRAGGQLGGVDVRRLLEQAGRAAASGDARLVALILAAAERLLHQHYAGDWRGDTQADRLADRIARLRAGLAPGSLDAAAAARELNALAGRLRVLSRP